MHEVKSRKNTCNVHDKDLFSLAHSLFSKKKIAHSSVEKWAKNEIS